jgi:nucleoside-diphosphate kinase
MAHEQTLAIIKPDAVGSNDIGGIIEYIEREGLSVVAAMMTHLKDADAKEFYAVHKDRPFYGELVEFMTSGPVLVMVLEGKDAVTVYRNVMGATDPAKADDGTIRADFARSIGENAVHGSDSKENATTEIEFFKKKGLHICPRNK